MRDLLPYLSLYRRHGLLMSLGVLLTLTTLLAGIALLSLSGWYLSAAAVAGATLAGRHQFNYLLPAGGVRFLSIARTASRWGERVVSHDATFHLLTRLRIQFWEKLAPLPAASLQGFRQGDLLNRLVADIDAMDHVYLRLITPLITALLTLGLLLLCLGWLDLELARVLTLGLLALALAIPTLLYYLGRQPGRQLSQSRARLRTGYVAYLDTQAELLLFGAEAQQRAALQTEEGQLIAAQRRMSLLAGLSSALLTLGSGVLMLAILWLSADGVGGREPDPLVALMTFITLAALEAISPLAGAFQHLASTLSSARRLNEITQEAKPLGFGEATLAPETQHTLRLSQVTFSYPGQSEPVVKELDLTLAPGEKLAILGATGCGKSTLVGLISREWQADSGALLLAEQPLASLSEAALRDSMAVVSQRVHLFSATLADNLRLAAPNASDEELIAVLQAVGLEGLLTDKASPQALQLWLGEGGRPLSGGELRRLGLARALLHDAPLLILDEATEGLDPSTEQAILDLIFEHARGKSLLMITHRLAGLAQMDRIALMEAGQIRTSGTHASLLAQDPYYQSLHQSLQ
ncbi:MAG: heme ABC transporter ATP-binding protein/permease CydC [Aeromonadaceae bacterium]